MRKGPGFWEPRYYRPLAGVGYLCTLLGSAGSLCSSCVIGRLSEQKLEDGSQMQRHRKSWAVRGFGQGVSGRKGRRGRECGRGRHDFYR
jgi:hypothetical protein